MARPRGPESVAVYLRLPTELRARLFAAADERMVAVNLVAIRAIEQFLDRLPPVDIAPDNNEPRTP